MKHLNNFKIFEKNIVIDFPDHIIEDFKNLLNKYFKDKKVKNKSLIISKLIKKFSEDAINNCFYPNGQGVSTVTASELLFNFGDDDDEGVYNLLSSKKYRDIILEYDENMIGEFIDNIIEDHYNDDYINYKKYIDAKKYNL